MPIYEYECGACGHRFELIQKFSDEPADVCPKCGAHNVQKRMSSPAIQFKGSGFYINDYARKDAGGTESKPSESKPSEKSTSEKSEKSEKPEKSDKTTPAPASSTPSTPSSSTDKS